MLCKPYPKQIRVGFFNLIDMESPFDNLFGLLKQETTSYNVKDLFRKEIKEYEPQIIDYVIDRWKRGEGVDGGKIGEYQNEDYAMFKNQQNPLAGFGNVDLIDTGDLKNGLFIQELWSVFIIKSSDEKYQMIANKYGIEQFGITEQQMKEILAEIKGNVLETIINNTYGK